MEGSGEDEDRETNYFECVLLVLTRTDYNYLVLNTEEGYQSRAKPFRPVDEEARRRVLGYINEWASAEKWQRYEADARSGQIVIQEKAARLRDIFRMNRVLSPPSSSALEGMKSLLQLDAATPAARRLVSIQNASNHANVRGLWDADTDEFVPDNDGYIYPWRGRGPPWTVNARKAPNASCAYDCVIQICIFAHVGSTLADRLIISQLNHLTPVETYLLEAIQAPWGMRQTKENIKALKQVKHKFQRAAVRAAATQEGQVENHKSVDGIFDACARLFGQTRVKLKWKLRCNSCGQERDETRNDVDTELSFFTPCISTTMADAIEQQLRPLEPSPRALSCLSCKAADITRFHSIVHPIPPRLAAHSISVNPDMILTADDHYDKLTEWADFAGITVRLPSDTLGSFIDTQWRFLGGIWCSEGHFRVQFLDTDVEEPNRRFKIYDGAADEPQWAGATIGGKSVYVDEDDKAHTIHPQWAGEPAAVWWERVV